MSPEEAQVEAIKRMARRAWLDSHTVARNAQTIVEADGLPEDALAEFLCFARALENSAEGIRTAVRKILRDAPK